MHPTQIYSRYFHVNREGINIYFGFEAAFGKRKCVFLDPLINKQQHTQVKNRDLLLLPFKDFFMLLAGNSYSDRYSHMPLRKQVAADYVFILKNNS